MDIEIQEEKLLMETRLSYLLGEVCRYKSDRPNYIKADMEIKKLIKKRISKLMNQGPIKGYRGQNEEYQLINKAARE